MTDYPFTAEQLQKVQVLEELVEKHPLLQHAATAYLDRKRKPITFAQWTVMKEDADYVQVAHTVVGKSRVSTVWLGIQFQPLAAIFETMTFFEKDYGPAYRSDTEAEARRKHRIAVREEVIRQRQHQGNGRSIAR